jgi:hypothetical protein
MAAPAPTATEVLSEGTSTRAALLARLIQRLGQELYYDTSVTNITSSSTNVAIAAGGASRYEVGDIIEWWEDGTLDAAFVSAVADTALTLQVPRGAFGTTAAAHDGSVTAKRFRKVPDSHWLSVNLSNYLDQAVNSLWPDVPVVQVSTYTTSATDDWYALPAGAEVVVAAYQMGTTAPVQQYPRFFGDQTWFHGGYVATNKAVRVYGLDTSLTSHYIISLARPAITELTSAQQDIVVYHAARLALEAAVVRPIDRADPTVIGAAQNIQLMRREEGRLRSAEHQRLASYRPSLDSIRYRGR